MATSRGLRLGTTLYSFTNEFHDRKYTLEQLIEKVAELQLGPGLELVGFSHVRGFPKVQDEFAGKFRELLAKLKLEPSCLGLNVDAFIRRDRPMTPDETLAYLDAQVEAAAKMGFPVARYQLLAGPGVVRRLLPKAERLNVKLGVEIHSPEKVDSPAVLKYREMYAKEQSPYLGFIPDFGSAAKRVPALFLKYIRDLGLPEALTAIALEVWQSPDDAVDPRAQKVAAFQAKAKAAGFTAKAMEEYFIIFGLFCRQEPRAWLEIMPQVVHIHGKFYDFDADGNESSIPYEEILPVFVEGGYNGFMSSEWEGHAFSDADSFAMVQQHYALCKRILAGTHAKSPGGR